MDDSRHPYLRYFSIGTLVIAFLLFYICYLIHCRQKKRMVAESFIDDDSYIESIEHLSGKVGVFIWPLQAKRPSRAPHIVDFFLFFCLYACKF